MEKQLVLWLFMLLMTINSSGQEEYDYSMFLNIDYLNYNYQYLDKDFKLKVSDQQFQDWIIKYGFFRNRITRYKDSVLVVLTGEFDNKHQASIATLEITYSWLRAGYYLWLSPKEAEALGKRYNFKYPYRLYEYFRSNDESIWDDNMKQFMSDLRNKVYKHTNDSSVFNMNTKKFTTFALVNNPQRIKDNEEYKKNFNSNNECKKRNCCQNQDSNKEPCDSLANSQ